MTDILYGTHASLFTGKARAYLDWKQVDYREVTPDLQIREKVIEPAVGRMVIPVIQCADGSILQDTTVIIDHYQAQLGGLSVYPDTPRQKFAALLLETFGDEWLVIPAMHYRWNYNEDWIYGEFGRNLMPDAAPEQQEAVGKMMGERFKALVPILGINEASIPAIEASYEALLADLDAHFTKHDYLFGSRPSIGDYGLIGPLYAHLYRDPESGRIMERLAPRVAEWVERMVTPPAPHTGEFLSDDVIPETLLPVLNRMMSEQLPNLVETADLMSKWGASSEDKELPRAVGMANYEVEGHQSARMAASFSLWMLQRALDYLNSLDGEDRVACEELLKEVGGEALIDFPMPFRLEFKNHRLWRA